MIKKKENVVMKRLLQFFLLILIWGIFSFPSQADDTDGRVLFISSYSYAWEQVQIQIEGIRDGLGEDIVLDYEFMDTKRVDTPEALQLFHDGLAYRLSAVEAYDVVILGDDAALNFALEYQEELFQGIPLIFEGVNDEELALSASEDPLITGVLEKLSVEKNIELGLMINPNAKRVVAILDDTLTGEAERKRFYKCAEQYPELEFDEINTSQLQTFSLRYELGSLSSDTILIYVVMTEDADGRQYTDKQSIQLITECAKVPTLRMVDGGIGDGLLGGNVVSMYKSGEIAAQMAVDIINGVSPESIAPVSDDTQIYCVDAEIMEKFGIDMSVLPEETKIINQKVSFFEENREVLIPGGALILALIGVIIFFFADNRRHRALVEELEEARKLMETASLHDFLTGIPNRNKFMSDLRSLVDAKTPCTVIMIDIDDFKKINDTLGHTAGDEALTQVAARLKEMESPILTPYRYAGDEFILILQSNQGKIVEKTAYQCRQIFISPFILNGGDVKVCGSIGIASYPKDTEDVEQLIIYADNAMYQVKKNGKNDFAYYSSEG